MSDPRASLPEAGPAGTPAAPACGLDGLYGHRLVGWAAPAQEDALPLDIELCIDALPVGRLRADQPRPDRLRSSGLPTLCGFVFHLPARWLDGQTHTLTLHHMPSGQEILGGRWQMPLTPDPQTGHRRPVIGHVDSLNKLFVTGWAYDPEADGPVQVQLVAHGVCVASAMADQFRPDLQAIGNGGRCAYALRVPSHLMGAEHTELQVREAVSGAILPGVKLALSARGISGCIEGLNGAAVTGWVAIQDAAGPISLQLWIDGELACNGQADTPRDEGLPGLHYTLGIPVEHLDGRPHELLVTLRQAPHRIAGHTALILPAWTTPIEALQQYAGTRQLRSYLSPLGPQRHESIRHGLALLAEQALQADDPQALQRVAQAVVAMSRGQEQVLRGPFAARQDYPGLLLNREDAPEVSIVIPAHNKFAVTYTCLASIAAARCRASFEVIVVDDGSSDETLMLPLVAPGITVVRHDEAQGFVGAVNAGAAQARGRWLVLLNNDTEVMSGWLDELIDPYTRFERVGLVGAKLVYPDGKLQEAGGLIWSNGQPWNVGRGANAADPAYQYTRQADYLSGACLMLPTPLWRELGGLDTRYAPAYYEDTDLAFRVRERGYKTLFTPFCEVIHHEGVSNGTSTSSSGLKRFQVINAPKFKQRWASVFRHHGVLGRDLPHVVQDRHTQLRVLVLDAQTLTPDLDAGSYSATQELRLLQSLGCKVTFMPANLAYMAGYTEALQRMGVEVVYAPFCFRMEAFIEQRGAEFDAIYIARYGVAEQVLDALREHLPDTPVLLNIHDLHFLREIREALQSRSAEQMQQALATREAELAVLRQVDLALSYSAVEQAVILSHNLADTRTHDCPWVVDTADEVPGFGQRTDIAFLGGFGHRPNVEAVVWFVGEVMPLLRQQLPGVALRVYGSKMPASLARLACEDVILEGFAPSTDAVYDQARVFVAPLLSGAGLKGKVIGAFARGVPTVMTPTAAEGTGARPGLDALVCTSPQAWADAIARLYQDEAAWQAMSQSCRDLTRQQYSFAHGREVMRDALQQVGLFPVDDPFFLYPLHIEV